MEIKCGFIEPTYRHIKYEAVDEDIYKCRNIKLNLCRGEKFCFQLIVHFNEDTFCSLDHNNNMDWDGLKNLVRISADCEEKIKDLKLSFLGYVPDDSGLVIADPILEQPYMKQQGRVAQSIWVEGTIPEECRAGNIEILFDFWYKKGFEDEVKLHTISAQLYVNDLKIVPIKESGFFMDLWQHPCNMARAYETALWSEEHWRIMDQYTKELASIGSKVITLVVSDIPWSGQGCFSEWRYPSNLFEYNMVKVKVDCENKLICDFSIIDRYIDMCKKYGIDGEIDLIGLLGVWSDEIGNPMENYSDSIRVRYFDEKLKNFKYIKHKEVLETYIFQLFQHFIEKGWWDKTRILTDEPVDLESFKGWMEFLESIIKTEKVKFKTPLFSAEFTEEYEKDFKDLVPIVQLYLNNKEKFKAIKKEKDTIGGRVEWYVCCNPDKPNTFLSSPLVESKAIGWLTYYFDFCGFLRWAYSLWPEDPFNRPGYKYPQFKAGDMFFVYPGKTGKPVRSLRWENLKMGVQDYGLIKMLEHSGMSHENICEKYLKQLLGDLKDMKGIETEIMKTKKTIMDYSLDFWKYNEVKEKLIKDIISS
jgi:hypothetical protein